MNLPDLSHLQFAVLGMLLGAEHKGRDIRKQLAALRVRQTGPAFYQMMARLEEAGYVEGWYTQKVVQGQILKERRYRICPAGERAWQASRSFYLDAIRASEKRKGMAHA
jgi:DNA-binding PadR family transcriptional regulator